MNKAKFVCPAVAVVGAALSFTPFGIISYIILILGTASTFLFYKKSGFITRIVISFLLITCLQQMMGLFFWKINIPFALPWALVPLYLVLLVALLRKQKRGGSLSFNINRDEILVALVAIACTAVISLTTFSGASIAQGALRYVARGFDNSTHMSMVLSNYNNQNYVYGNNTSGKILDGFGGYPQGWHLTNSLLWQGLPTELTTAKPTILLLVYTATTLLWYGIMIFLVLRLLVSLSSKLLGKQLGVIEYGAVVTAVILMQTIVLTGLLSSGFSNYIAVLAYFIGGLILLFEYIEMRIELAAYVLLLSILAAGISLTWLLTAPLGYLLIILPFLLDKRPFFAIMLFVRNNILITLLSLAVLLFGMTQVFIQLKFGTGLNHLNAWGVSWPINQLLFAGLFSVSIPLMFSSKVPLGLRRFTQLTFACTALIVGAVYVYQYHTTAQVNYYSEKLSLSLEILLLIFASVAFVYGASLLASRMNKLASLFVIVGIFFAVPVAFGLDTSSTRYALGHRELSETSAAQVVELLASGQGKHNNIIVMKQLNQFEDVSTTHTLDLLAESVAPDECSRALNNALFLGKPEPRIQAVQLCAGLHQDRTYYVIAANNNSQYLTESFSSIPNVEIILSN